MPLGIYLSVPFCRTKCSYCNFASDVFSRAVFRKYVDRVCQDIVHAPVTAQQLGAIWEGEADSIYLGGGTPTVLDPAEIERLFAALRQTFDVTPQAEITVECAPGTLTPTMLDTLMNSGVNRVSLGVQSFVDQEAAAVGRLHKRTTVIDDIARLRRAGIENINIDLIAGLPHQTAQSWDTSLTEAVNSAVPHVSVYMLEVDEDSRLGRELIAGGTRYHAHFVPDEDRTADFYEAACERLNSTGIGQYEISNFARPGAESRHNLKYWTRQPYLGFGVDAHSMLLTAPGDGRAAVRFSTPESLEQFSAGRPLKIAPVSHAAAMEESFFLGLRLNRGIDLSALKAGHGTGPITALFPQITELVNSGLLARDGDVIRLTPRGRLLSNEVFADFLGEPQADPH